MNSQYAALIKEELDATDQTANDFRARSLTVVTTAGGLVTLLAGLISIAAGTRKDVGIPGSSHLPLALALVFFVLAAVFALLVHIPRDIHRATVPGLRELVTSDDGDEKAAIDIANLRIKTLEGLRGVVKDWAKLLLSAIFFEIVAVACAGWMAWTVIEHL